MRPEFRSSPRLYSGRAVAAIDAQIQRADGVSADELMARAGRGSFAWLKARWPGAGHLCVCAGVGNNAGDGYIVAREAYEAGLSVTVIQIEGRRLSGAAGRAQDALPDGVAVLELKALDSPAWPQIQAALNQADVIVDALLGIGLSSAARPLFAALIAAMNESATAVLSLDVPSGLDADRASAPGAIVSAAATATYLVDKQALHTGAGPRHCGEIRVFDLGISPRSYPQFSAAERQGPGLRLQDLALPPLPVDSYKHRLGRIVVVGGDRGMGGAALLTADAALACGAGLVTLVSRPETAAAALARNPALMAVSTDRWPQAQRLIHEAEVVLCGPGLGRGAWGRALLAEVLRCKAKRVFDADALNLLAGAPTPLAGAVLTPHEGEAARLLGVASRAVAVDRFGTVAALADRFAATVVLKGPGSLIQGAKEPALLCLEGQPGMATAGMGDVLTGVVGALLAGLGDQPTTETVVSTTAAAVTLHGGAGTLAAAAGERRALTAPRLLYWLRRAVALAENQAGGWTELEAGGPGCESR